MSSQSLITLCIVNSTVTVVFSVSESCNFDQQSYELNRMQTVIPAQLIASDEFFSHVLIEKQWPARRPESHAVMRLMTMHECTVLLTHYLVSLCIWYWWFGGLVTMVMHLQWSVINIREGLDSKADWSIWQCLCWQQMRMKTGLLQDPHHQ